MRYALLWKMAKANIIVLFLISLGFIVGLMLGTIYGGNFAVDFQFAGQTGYEATGILVGTIGAILGAFTSFRILRRR